MKFFKAGMEQCANFAICFRNNLRIKWCYQLPDACVIRW
jgi:hypothetical protein